MIADDYEAAPACRSCLLSAYPVPLPSAIWRACVRRSAVRAPAPRGAAHSVERSRVSMGSHADARRRGRPTRPRRSTPSSTSFASSIGSKSLLSVWKDGSDVVRMNKNAGIAPVPVSQDTLDVLAKPREASELHPRQVRHHLRRAERHLAVRSRPGQRRARSAADRSAADPHRLSRGADRHARRARRSSHRPGMRVHLGGIGKGYAIDRAIAHAQGARLHGLPDPVRRRSLRGRHQRRPAVEARHRRSARRARSVRHAADQRRHVQHLRRLRALLHEGRQALSPPDRSGFRRAGERLPQRDDRRRTAR